MTVSLEKVLISLKCPTDIWLQCFLSYSHASILGSVPTGLTESFISIHYVSTFILLDLQGALHSSRLVCSLKQKVRCKARIAQSTSVPLVALKGDAEPPKLRCW